MNAYKIKKKKTENRQIEILTHNPANGNAKRIFFSFWGANCSK